MHFVPLPFRSPLADYAQQAEDLFTAWQAGEPSAVSVFHHKHPRFLDEKVPWLPRRVGDDEIRGARLGPDDARLAVARLYDFLDWSALKAWVLAVTEVGSSVAGFEAGVEAVINGDVPALATLLSKYPELVRERSSRVCCFEPPQHRATLLHYVAANGVESYRQKTPANVVEIARTLLEAGADPNALADMYGGQCTVMSMLVSSDHPAKAGVQVALLDLLVDHGASVEALGAGNWKSPLMTALTFSFRDAADALVRRGARVDNVAAAAGMGRVDDVRRLLPSASPIERHRALALAAQHGHSAIVRVLLDAGEDPNRYNPEGHHAHSTPLHQAVCAGHEEIVRLLLDRGARLDLRDTIWQATPLGWAEHGGRGEIAQFLRAHGGA